MKYYIFKVKNSLGKPYYIVNNMYLGYIGFDSDDFRVMIEHHVNNDKETYQLYAKGLVANDHALHKIFCNSTRLNKFKADKLIKRFNLTKSNNKAWYKVVNPNPNTSETRLEKVITTADDNIFSE